MLKFELARNALSYLIKEYKIKEIYIPYYICDVVRQTIIKSSCKPLFYHIDDNFMPMQEFPIGAFILYPNYFGVFDDNVSILVKKYPKLVIDNAHSYYSSPKGFASFNAGHKFGFKDSYLFIGEENFKILCDSERRKTFFEYHNKYKQRNTLNINLLQSSIPFCYPFLASTGEEADKLVTILNQEGLTIYRYWNPLPQSYNEYKFYRRLVPIPLN